MDKAKNINPNMLIWARDTAGLTLSDAALKIGFSTSKNSSAAEKLMAIEEAEKFPTRKQLLNMANVYRKPLTVFYLNSPPIRSDHGADFRSPDTDITRREKALLDSLIVNIGARQSLVRSLLVSEEDAPELGYVNSLNVNVSIKDAARQIKELLDFEIGSATHNRGSPRKLFTNLRNKTEQLGVFVQLAGDLGSWQSKITENLFRGFATTDTIAPFIVINSNDAHAARPFTLLHELCHIFLGSSSISGSIETASDCPVEIERYCNDVASEILLPSANFESLESCKSIEMAKKTINKVAKNYCVSESSVTYKLLKMNKIDREIANYLFPYFQNRWKELRKNQNQSRINRNDIKRNQLGKALINLVSRNLRENELTNTKAAIILGVKPTSVDALLKIG